MTQPNTDGYVGRQEPSSNASDYDAHVFLIRSILDGRNVATLVQVKAVTNAGGVSAVGFVDVQPMVNQLDGEKNAVPHGVIHSLPYFRLQGGANAIILDPQVGDIGVAVFADRDISAVKASKATANPGSSRRSSKADGIYFGGPLNDVPNQFVRFAADGIHVTSLTAVHITAPVINSTGAWAHTGTIVATGDIVGDGISLDNHTHTGITPGGANTGGPV